MRIFIVCNKKLLAPLPLPSPTTLILKMRV